MDTRPVDTGASDAPLPRRAFVKTALYVTPAILTLKAAPAFASYGSGAAPSSEGSDSHSGKSKPFDPPRGRDNAPGQLKKIETQTSQQPSGKDSAPGQLKKIETQTSQQTSKGPKH